MRLYSQYQIPTQFPFVSHFFLGGGSSLGSQGAARSPSTSHAASSEPAMCARPPLFRTFPLCLERSGGSSLGSQGARASNNSTHGMPSPAAEAGEAARLVGNLLGRIQQVCVHFYYVYISTLLYVRVSPIPRLFVLCVRVRLTKQGGLVGDLLLLGGRKKNIRPFYAFFSIVSSGLSSLRAR